MGSCVLPTTNLIGESDETVNGYRAAVFDGSHIPINVLTQIGRAHV